MFTKLSNDMMLSKRAMSKVLDFLLAHVYTFWNKITLAKKVVGLNVIMRLEHYFEMCISLS